MTANPSEELGKQLDELSHALGFDAPGLHLSWVADQPISTDLTRLADLDAATIICEVYDRDELGRPLGRRSVVFVLRRTDRDHEQEPFYSFCDLSSFASASEAGESAESICELFWWKDQDSGAVHRFDVSVEWPLGRRLDPERELRPATIKNIYGSNETQRVLVDEGLATSFDLLDQKIEPRSPADGYREWTPAECHQPESGT